MDTPTPPSPTPKPAPKSKGIPLWTALVALVLLALVGIAALGAVWYYTRSDKARLERKLKELEAQQTRAKIEEAKADASAKSAVARNQQEQVLEQARKATNALTHLLQDANQLAADAESLKSNETGRAVALHPDLLAQARRFFETELPALPSSKDIISKLEGARRIELQLASSLGTTYEPTDAVAGEAHDGVMWAEQQSRAVDKCRALLSALVQESKVKVAPTPLSVSSPTLGTAIQQLNQSDATSRQQTIVEKTSQATTQAVDTIAQANAERILTEARIQASNILAQANEAKTQQERETLKRQAESKVEDSKARVAASQSEDEAKRVELRKKAADPEVQNQLAPFLTPGYWRPGAAGNISYDKKPHSLSQLQGSGALDESLAGLRKLADIACSTRDQLRPRWKLPQYWPKNPQQLEKVKAAQQLLIELGPVLVELKMLEP